MSGDEGASTQKKGLVEEVKLEEGGVISRRKLLASIGITGAAIVAGGLLPSVTFAACRCFRLAVARICFLNKWTV